ncbi:hypothetical protein ACHAPO_007124 [Fusarium lateritium]
MPPNPSNADRVRFEHILAREKLMPAVRNALEALGPVIQKGSREHGKEDKSCDAKGGDKK